MCYNFYNILFEIDGFRINTYYILALGFKKGDDRVWHMKLVEERIKMEEDMKLGG